jgi:hypothetical protein
MKIRLVSVALVVLALTLAGVPLGNAQPPAGIELGQGRAIVEVFFSKLQEGKADEAYEYLASQNPIVGATRREDVEKAKAQFLASVKLIGEYRGYELLSEKAASGRFIHFTYFGYFDRQPVRFHFELYKPKDAWLMYSFTFDDKFVEEIRDAAKKRWE